MKKRQRETPAAPPPPTYHVTDDHIRSVVPYVHEFRTYAKGRWLNRQLIDVLTQEFGSHPKSYWEEAIAAGNVTVDNEVVPLTHKLKNGEMLSHKTHRHEPPVSGKIEFVNDVGDLIAVCKPASMPMHPCGAYRQNSLCTILRYVRLVFLSTNHEC
jgi:tRNA pseudouridine synthase 9